MKACSDLQERRGKGVDMENKKGVSTLIATVLLMLITVAAVGIISGFVLPMLQEKITEASQSCISAQIKIDTEGGYTCYDLLNKQLNVRISRGSDEIELAGLQIIASVGGSSYKYEISDDIVDVNGYKVYTLDITAGDVQQAAVAPILKIGKSKKICGITSKASINSCNI